MKPIENLWVIEKKKIKKCTITNKNGPIEGLIQIEICTGPNLARGLYSARPAGQVGPDRQMTGVLSNRPCQAGR